MGIGRPREVRKPKEGADSAKASGIIISGRTGGAGQRLLGVGAVHRLQEASNPGQSHICLEGKAQELEICHDVG